jgi:riboflavin kinase/FMN adenylyltransferase
MRIVRDTEALHAGLSGAFCATVGNFDGFHRGHAAVVAELVAVARRRSVPAVALTFDPHPLSVVGNPQRPFALTPGAEREELMAEAGLDAMVVAPFDAVVAAMSAKDFLADLGRGRLSHLVLGYDFRMGKGRATGVDGLAAMLSGGACALDVVPPVMHRGAPVSSSRIRDALWSGDAVEAAGMLGRAYRLRGRVVAGDGVGTRLGYPTANLLLPPGKLVPADGVYRAGVGGADSPGLLYVGTRPTLGCAERRVEVHVPGWRGAAQGTELEVEVMGFLRGDRGFPSIEELRDQIRRDVDEVLRASGGCPGGRRFCF